MPTKAAFNTVVSLGGVSGRLKHMLVSLERRADVMKPWSTASCVARIDYVEKKLYQQMKIDEQKCIRRQERIRWHPQPKVLARQCTSQRGGLSGFSSTNLDKLAFAKILTPPIRPKPLSSLSKKSSTPPS